MAGYGPRDYDHLFKLLIIGDSDCDLCSLLPSNVPSGIEVPPRLLSPALPSRIASSDLKTVA
ncbi:hypothetical protein NECAME_11594 [Necator americanus]|uniref:Uncharacterized protein n=1 Tax=Necator americanus TaxID=51031 RepID=W2T3G7_NECAM|nr:hypothetical protein NECAME_11594 [Necator americanus]ETN76560.1 hypothetical protein NECAME_11594 [Necator americanus]